MVEPGTVIMINTAGTKMIYTGLYRNKQKLCRLKDNNGIVSSEFLINTVLAHSHPDEWIAKPLTENPEEG